MSTAYTGALKPKKKSELQEIATNLSVSASGTKDELEQRIRDHLDANEHKLIDDPMYAGLYSRKKRQTTANLTVPSIHTPGHSDDESTPPPAARNTRKASRGAVALRNKEHSLVPVEPTQLPLPPSPVRSLINEVREVIEEPAVVVERVRASELLRGSEVFLENLRTFISHSGNIATITVVSELLFIVYTIVPWSYFHIPLTPPFKSTGVDKSGVIAHIPYAPPAYVASAAPWHAVLLWALPTLIIPQLFGALISFSTPRRKVDPLSAAIVRVACAVAGQWGVGEGVLATKWRILSASLAAAFALAETIESAGRRS
ncbi:hypothetical protein AURDEDRAFT_114874 [Auricularia subglabra TFB-10046 SS5]|nr:hypothetical protein AURDEDRAFT_114874 [Auricularia subglabra TFB-10046 SS5]